MTIWQWVQVVEKIMDKAVPDEERARALAKLVRHIGEDRIAEIRARAVETGAPDNTLEVLQLARRQADELRQSLETAALGL